MRAVPASDPFWRCVHPSPLEPAAGPGRGLRRSARHLLRSAGIVRRPLTPILDEVMSSPQGNSSRTRPAPAFPDENLNGRSKDLVSPGTHEPALCVSPRTTQPR